MPAIFTGSESEGESPKKAVNEFAGRLKALRELLLQDKADSIANQQIKQKEKVLDRKVTGGQTSLLSASSPIGGALAQLNILRRKNR